MAENKKLDWDKTGEHFYETGVSDVVLYVYDELTSAYGNGVAWSGVTAINEKPSGAEANDQYADNILYLSIRSAEKFAFTIEAFQSPKEFDACDGAAKFAKGVSIGQQSRKMFGLVYKTLIGNDTKGSDAGYKLHIVYGATAAPSQRDRNTVNSSVEPGKLSWEATTTPVSVPGFKPTAHIEINSMEVDISKLAEFEKIVFGSESGAAKLPLPAEILSVFNG